MDFLVEFTKNRQVWSLALPWLIVASAFILYWLWARRLMAEFLRIEPWPATPNHRAVEELLGKVALRAQVPQPELGIISDFSANALVLSRGRKSQIALTRGALEVLSLAELEGLLAMALARTQGRGSHRAMGVALLAVPLEKLSQRAPAILAVLLHTLILSLVRAVVSQRRALQQDALALKWVRNPDTLAQALRKMSSLSRKVPLAGQSLALNHLYLLSSLNDDFLTGFISVHPAVEDRVQLILRTSLPCESGAILR